MQLGAANVIPNGAGLGNVTVDGVLDMGGLSATVNGLSGAGWVDNSLGVGTYTLTIGNNDQTSTFNGIIRDTSGTVEVTKIGTGGLTLNGANDYDGATRLNAGVLTIGHATALGTAVAGTTVANGTRLRLINNFTIVAEALSLAGDGGGLGALENGSGGHDWAGSVTLTDNAAIGVTASGALAISGAITDGAGNFNLTKVGSIGTLFLSGNNSYDGTTTVSAGTLNIQNANALGSTATGTTVSNGATLALQGGIVYAAEPLTLNGTGGGIGALNSVSGNNTWQGTVTLGSGSYIGSTAGLLTLSNTVDTSVYTVGFVENGNTTVDGVITGAGNLEKRGTGLLTLTANNNYGGSTTVIAGVLNIRTDTATGTTTWAGVWVSNGSKLQLENNITVTLPLTLNGGGACELENLSGNNTWQRSIYLDTAATIGSTAGLLTLNSSINTNNKLLTFVGAGNTTAAGEIKNTGGLTKAGTGTLVLSYANTYGNCLAP